MSKLIFVLVFVAAAVSGQGQQDQLETAAQSGKWEDFNKLLSQNNEFKSWPAPPQPSDIKGLKPGPGTKVYGQSISAFKSSSTVNGRRTDFSAGHKVTNDNGKIVESDFKP